METKNNNINQLQSNKNSEEKKHNDTSKNAKKQILDTIVLKSIQCSKKTVDRTAKILDSIMSGNKNQLISFCESGLPDDLPVLRSLIWKISLNYLPLNFGEWDKILSAQRKAYDCYKNSVIEKLSKELKLFQGYENMTDEEKKKLEKTTSKVVLEEICKDTNRTHTEMNFFFKPVDGHNTFTEKEVVQLFENKRNCTLKDINSTYKINIVLTHCDVISRILFIYSKFEPEISYVQGMNEILAPIYYCFSFDKLDENETINDVEADAFWSFYHLMEKLKFLFDKNEDKNDRGIFGKVQRLKLMLKSIDSKLYNRLEMLNFDFSLIVFKWINLLFSQDFVMVDILRLWDYLLCRDNKFENVYYFCLSIILMKKEFIMKSELNYIYENLQNIQEMDIESIISNALYIASKKRKKFNEIINAVYKNKNKV